MKTKIKVTIGDNIYEIESSYESGYESIKGFIETIVKQQILLNEKP